MDVEVFDFEKPAHGAKIGKAGRPVAGAELARLRRPQLAGGDRNAAARQERAERDGIDQVGRHALDRRQAARTRAIDPRRRAHEAQRIAMARPVEQLADRSRFDDGPGIHDVDAIAEAGDHAEVVADPDHRRAALARQALHQVDDLRLDGDVERRRRLVGDQQARIAGERDGDHHALAHAAGELVGVGAEPLAGHRYAHGFEQLDRPPSRRGAGELLMAVQHLGQLAADGEHRIERAHRILEDHGHACAADLARLRFAQRQEIGAVEGHRIGGDLAGRLGNQAHDRQRRHALAAAAFADQAQDLAFLEVEGDTVDRAHRAAVGGEPGSQVADAEQRHRSSPSPGRRCAACARRAGRGHRAARRP